MADPTKRKPIPPKLRFKILKRDSFTCKYCGKTASESELHVDHIIPVSKGGKTCTSNLVAACINCNLGKSNTAFVVPLDTRNPLDFLNLIVGDIENPAQQKLNSINIEQFENEHEFNNWIHELDIQDNINNLKLEYSDILEEEFNLWVFNSDLSDDIINLSLADKDMMIELEDDLNTWLASQDTIDYDFHLLDSFEFDLNIEAHTKWLIDQWDKTYITDPETKEYVIKLKECYRAEYFDNDYAKVQKLQIEMNETGNKYIEASYNKLRTQIKDEEKRQGSYIKTALDKISDKYRHIFSKTSPTPHTNQLY